jgi:hypothetical protein
MRAKYEEALSQGARVIFVDEAVFSPNTMLLRSWAAPYQSIEVEDIRNKLKT